MRTARSCSGVPALLWLLTSGCSGGSCCCHHLKRASFVRKTIMWCIFKLSPDLVNLLLLRVGPVGRYLMGEGRGEPTSALWQGHCKGFRKLSEKSAVGVRSSGDFQEIFVLDASVDREIWKSIKKIPIISENYLSNVTNCCQINLTILTIYPNHQDFD